jgi:SWI/SNF-related matrix-associated actin-dependent regulator 1 of chromatin subfamily A
MNIDRSERIKQLYGSKYAAQGQTKQGGILTPCRDRKATLDGEYCVMTFPRNKEVIDLVKRITQRAYVTGSTIQVWEAPISFDCLEKLREGGFSISDEILDWEDEIKRPVVYNPNFTVPGINHWDYFEEYQKQGVQFIEQKNGRALISDDPGLGKTMQIISWLQLRQDVNPVLIICPANAKWTWYDEFHFWMNKPNVQMINGNAHTEIWGDFVIINYEVLTQLKDKENVFRQDIWNEKWQCIICDEGHYISNEETIRGWAVKQIVERTPHVIIATATPGDKNRHKFTLCNLVDKRVFPSFYKFAHRFCNPTKGFKGQWEFNGSSNELELNELLKSTILLRRTKEQVFKDLPKLIRQVVPLPINNQLEYDKADDDFYAWQVKNRDNENLVNTGFSKIEALTQLAIKGMFPAAVEWLWNLLDTSKKIIIFCEHKTVVEMLVKEYKELAVVVDGATSDKKREEAKQLFQQCKRCKVRKEKHDYDDNACEEYVYDLSKRIIICTRAGKESITLTAAYDEVFIETWWSGIDHTQAEGRAYGRKGDLHGATAWYLCAHGTIMEYKLKVLDVKNMRNEKVMNGRELSQKEMLTELLKEYNK